jgi:ABC-type multidrug transport system fused ATPase/permease subunit
LLDEATSALDSESERIVQQAIDSASKGRTTIAIAHRLSTIQNADKIVVMERGVILETGTHTSLVESNGVYAGLVLSQSLKSRTQNSLNVPDTIRTSSRLSQSKKVKEEVEITVEAGKDETKPVKLDYKRLLNWSRPEFPIFAIAGFGALLNGAAQPLFAVVFSAVLPALGTERANFYALLFLILAFVAFAANFLQGLFKYAGEKAVRRLRYASFEAILKQEVGFFDLPENSIGALMNSLAEDASLTPGLTGQTFGAAVQAIGGVGAGLVIALVACWQLALVVLGMVPIIGFAGYMQFQTLVGFGAKTKKAYEAVSQNASEAISEIKTINTITQETHFVNVFNAAILIPHKVTVSGAFVSAAGFALGQCILHFTWGFSLFYSAQLMKWGLYSSSDVLTAMFSIIFTAMAVGQVSNFAPDAAKVILLINVRLKQVR